MKFIKILSINLIIILLLVCLIEFVVVNFNKDKIKCSYVLCNHNVSYENNLYDTIEIVNYKKDEYGFRGRVKKVSEIDILVFGGSTTDERYLNLNDTWIEQLELLLNKKNYHIDIVNAGIDGQSTYGHIWNFNNWINRIDNFKTKFIFFYIGINDSSTPGMFDLDSTNYEKFSLKNKIKFNIKNNNAFIYGLYKAYLKIRILLGLDINPGHNKKIPKIDEFYLDESEYIHDDQKFKMSFKNNLQQLTSLTREIGAEPIFITQRSLRWFKKENKIYNYQNTKAYQIELLSKNIIINYCDENNLFCVDVFSNLDLEPKDTYDLVHLTPRGSKKVAKILESQILKDKTFLNKIMKLNLLNDRDTK